MKRLFILLLIISLLLNLYYIFKKIHLSVKTSQTNKLATFNSTDYKTGFEYFKKKMEVCLPESSLKKTIVYVWDTIRFSYNYLASMQALDSLSIKLSPHVYNFIFATVVNQKEADDFIANRHLHFKNFKIIGGMDDFISGIYNKGHYESKGLFIGDTIKAKENYELLKRIKHRHNYLLLDSLGNILFYNHKFKNVLNDTAFINILNKFSYKKSIIKVS